jgi:hypothetical protein
MLARAEVLCALALWSCEGSQRTPVEPEPQFKRVELQTGMSPGGVEVADLNGDTKPDLIVTNESGSVSILMAEAEGRFHTAPGSPFAAGLAPNDVAIGDYNGDNKPDLAFANHEAHALAVLLGDGRGGFVPAPGVAVRSVPHPHGIAAADLDRDGHVDLVVDSWGQNELELFRGDGRGGFAEWQTVPVGNHPYQRPRIADVNNDRWPDLLTSNLDSKDLSVLLGGPHGFVPAKGSPFAAGDGPFGLAAGDFDGDGNVDVAVVNSPSSAVQDGRDGVTILLGDGAGRFVARPPLETGARPNRIATGDIDGNDQDDVVVSRPDSDSIIIFFLGKRAALVRRAEIRVGKGAKGVAVGDFDGRGGNDIAVTLQGSAQLILLIR